MSLRKHNHADWSHFNSMAVDSTPRDLCHISSSCPPLHFLSCAPTPSSSSLQLVALPRTSSRRQNYILQGWRLGSPVLWFLTVFGQLGEPAGDWRVRSDEFLPARSKNGSGAIYLLKDTAPARQPLTHYNLSGSHSPCSPRAESGSPRFAAMGCFAIPCWFCLTLSSQFYRLSS